MLNKLSGVGILFSSVENAEIDDRCESIPTLILKSGHKLIDAGLLNGSKAADAAVSCGTATLTASLSVESLV